MFKVFEKFQRLICKWIFIGLFFSLISYSIDVAKAQKNFVWNLPSWAPVPKIPKDNPMSDAKVNLGRHLFYEKRLSISRTMSCGSCHQQKKAFTDGRRIALGATGQNHSRNTLTLANVAYSPILTWADPGSRRLEEHPLTPLFSVDPIEMGMSGQRKKIVEWLKTDPEYRLRFILSFPESKNKVSIENIAKALAAFQRTLISFSSPYDQYRFNGEQQAISSSAKRGERLFFSERLNCFQCHQAPFFTDSYTYLGLPFNEIAFHNTGLYNLSESGNYPDPNTGMYKHTRRTGDLGRFRTPSLRNVELTGPYMHNGIFDSLDAVLDFYSRGGQKTEADALAGDGAKKPFKSSYVTGFRLSLQEKKDVIEFLKSLTDLTFTQDQRYSEPRASSIVP